MDYNFLPRFRGIALEVEGGWSWEACVTFLGDNENILSFKSSNIFSTKEEAIKDMKEAIRIGCDAIQEKFMGEVTGNYIDMKTNETLNWNKSKQN